MIVLALPLPAAGLDDVLPVDRQAELLFHGGFDVGLQPVERATDAGLVVDILPRARMKLLYQAGEIDGAVIFEGRRASQVVQKPVPQNAKYLEPYSRLRGHYDLSLNAGGMGTAFDDEQAPRMVGGQRLKKDRQRPLRIDRDRGMAQGRRRTGRGGASDPLLDVDLATYEIGQGSTMNPILVEEALIDVRRVHDEITRRLGGRPVAGEEWPFPAVVGNAQGHTQVADIDPEYPSGDLLDVRLELGKPASDKCQNALPIDFDAEFPAPPFPIAEGENRPFALRAPKVVPSLVQCVINVNPARTVPVLRRKVPILGIGAEHVFTDARLQDSGLLQVGCRMEQRRRRLPIYRPVPQEPINLFPANA